MYIQSGFKKNIYSIYKGVFSHPIGRVVGRRLKCLRSGDTGSKPPGVPCGVAQILLRGLRPLRVRCVQAKLE